VKRIIRLLAALALVAGPSVAGGYAGGAGEEVREPVASVNGVQIPRSYWEREIMRFEDQLRRQGQVVDGPTRERLAGEALDTLVNMELLYQETQRRGITVPAEEVRQQVESLKGRFGDEEAYAQTMEQTGYTEAELESEILRQMAIESLLARDIAPGVSLSSEEVRGYYDANPELFRTPEQVRARHILIRLDRGAQPEAQRDALERIQDIRRRIVGGEDFAALAREVSEDGSREQGGDLGFFSREQMVPEFAEAAFALSPGTVSEPIRTDFGYHLIEVTDRKEAQALEYSEVEPQLRGYLRHEKLMGALDELVLQLREGARIEKYP
jgi:peptidyl-prolyl cis-trans isomerase C